MPSACSSRNWDNAVVLALLAGLSLGGCTEKPETPPQKITLVPPASEPVQILRPPAARPARSPARIPAQKTAKKRPRVDPVTLVGMDPPTVDRMLGRPAGTRMDAMAVEWTYAAPSCSLSLYFYPDVATGDLKVLKYNITGRQAGGGCDFPMMARNDESD
jgi:hypothetical protein